MIIPEKTKGEINTLLLIPALLVLIPAIAFFTTQPKTKTTPPPTNVETVNTLYLEPKEATKPQGELLPANVWLNAGDQKILFAQMKLNFNKNTLKVVSPIKTTPSMGTIMKLSTPEEANNLGVIEIILGTPGGQSPPSGKINLATIIFDGKNKGTALVNFDNKEIQIVKLGAKVIPVSSSGASYTIK